MKKVILNDDKAVSPIIATILLVAITVVLAATLYTILGGYTTFLGASTPSASIEVTTDSTSPPIYTLYVQQYSGNISLSQVEMVITTTNNTVKDVNLMTEYNKTVEIGGLWNISVSGASSYFGVTTTVLIKSVNNASGDQSIQQVSLKDLKTGGTIVTYPLTQPI
jgi:flagellin-like protein